MDRSWPRSGGGQLRKGGVLVPGASRARSALFQLMNRPFRGGKDVTSKVLRPACAVPFRCECTVHYSVMPVYMWVCVFEHEHEPECESECVCASG